jgi:hypothetical protein
MEFGDILRCVLSVAVICFIAWNYIQNKRALNPERENGSIVSNNVEGTNAETTNAETTNAETTNAETTNAEGTNEQNSVSASNGTDQALVVYGSSRNTGAVEMSSAIMVRPTEIISGGTLALRQGGKKSNSDCRLWLNSGGKGCPYGNSCGFQHPEMDENRKVVPRSIFNKATICWELLMNGFCKFGNNCVFSHNNMILSQKANSVLFRKSPDGTLLPFEKYKDIILEYFLVKHIPSKRSFYIFCNVPLGKLKTAELKKICAYYYEEFNIDLYEHFVKGNIRQFDENTLELIADGQYLIEVIERHVVPTAKSDFTISEKRPVIFRFKSRDICPKTRENTVCRKKDCPYLHTNPKDAVFGHLNDTFCLFSGNCTKTDTTCLRHHFACFDSIYHTIGRGSKEVKRCKGECGVNMCHTKIPTNSFYPDEFLRIFLTTKPFQPGDNDWEDAYEGLQKKFTDHNGRVRKELIKEFVPGVYTQQNNPLASPYCLECSK